MKHALRKYISPCGSALFMVVSTMAALIVLVTAMYMSVLSSRQVQYATFDQEQAYVTSTSVADVIAAYISDSDHSKSELVGKVLKLNEGESISTKGNGFASLSSTGTEEDTVLGGYTVDITRLKDEKYSGKTVHIFDIAVTASQNGIVETTHTYLRTTDPEKTNIEPIDRFFTATGYIPNDVIAGGGTFTETMYFDSEYTMFTKPKGFDSQALTLETDMICAGSAVFDHASGNPVCLDEPTIWYIGNNMYLKSQPDKFALGGQNGHTTDPKDENHGMIIVGGDLEMVTNDNFQIGENNKFTDVYVLGDCYLGNCKFYGNLYVKGNLIFTTSAWNEMGKEKGYGNFYVDGEVTALDGVVPHLNGLNYQGHTKEGEGAQAVFAEAKKYGKWKDIEDTDYTYTAEEITEMLNTKIGGSTYPKWIADTSNMEKEGNKPKTVDIEFKLGGENSVYTYVIDKDCKIGAIKSTGNYVNEATIIIDTGDADTVRTITLSANCADGESFSWCPETVLEGRNVNVLTVGKGTLVVDVPEGVRYQSTDQEFFGHIGWFYLLGGKEGTKDGQKYYYRADGFKLNDPDKDVIIPNKLIHDTCSSCAYEPTTNEKGETVYKCTNSDHYKELAENPTECVCKGYIDKSAVNSYVSANSIDMTYNGVSQTPNVNIWVISCSESADIQFGGDDVMNNLYFGYVYAPYMTYVDKGSGGGVKSIGGLIVSDYVITGYYRYMYCIPDKSIEDLVGDDWDSLPAYSSRTWRVHGV